MKDTQRSSSWIKRDSACIWHPMTQAKTADPPLPIVAGEGAYLIAESGERYLDAIASWWVNLHGHAHPYIAKKIHEQLLRLEHVIFAGFTHPPAIELSERLLQVLPSRQAKVFFSDNGSTAVEIGVKMAMQYFHNLGKPKKYLIALENAFHGETFGAMSASADLSLNNAYKSHLFEVKRIPVPTEGNLEHAVKALSQHLYTGEIYGFLFEPLVQGAGGMQMYPPEHLDALIALCQENEVLCIADEVMTGFGRTGKLFASHYLQHQPDIMCLSKGITGGTLPLAVTTCTQQVFDAFLSEDKYKTFFHGHSYTANPVGCAAGLASLDLLLGDACQQQMADIAESHAAFLQKVKGHPTLKEVRQRGTILALEFQTGDESGYFNTIRDRLYNYFLERNILLRPLGNVLYLMPPYCIEANDLHRIYQHIEAFMEEYNKTLQYK